MDHVLERFDMLEIVQKCIELTYKCICVHVYSVRLMALSSYEKKVCVV